VVTVAVEAVAVEENFIMLTSYQGQHITRTNFPVLVVTFNEADSSTAVRRPTADDSSSDKAATER